MVSAVIDIEPWQERWAAARAARTAGRTSAALDLSRAVVAAQPQSAEPYFETADFLCELQHNLAGLDRLYQRHREAFGLSPEDLTWRPPQFPSARNGLEQVATLLRIASGASPENSSWQYRLAEALDRIGETDESICRREHIATIFPAFPENQWALLKLLERTGDYERARQYGDSLIVRGSAAPEATLAQARIYIRLGQPQVAQLLIERLRARISSNEPTSPEQTDFLFRLAWTATQDGMPADCDELRTELRHYCAIAAHNNFSDAKARLADGYACLIAGDDDRAKVSFAIASWIVSQNDEQYAGPLAGIDAFHSALRYARAFLLDLAPPPSLHDDAPSVHSMELALAHSHWLRKSGRLIEALTELARWLAAVPDMIIPPTYNGHYIALRNGIYFGIPLSETRFTIIGGKVYRITPLILIVAKLVPARVRKLVHRSSLTAVFESRDRKARGGPWRSVARAFLTNVRVKQTIVALVRRLLTRQSVSNVLEAPNLHKLFADIDKRLMTADRRVDGRSPAE